MINNTLTQFKEVEVMKENLKRIGRMPGFVTGLVVVAAICAGLVLAQPLYAATKKEINTSVEVTVARFKKDVKGGSEFLKAAKGVLVFPKIVKAGLGVGGEYGNGALLIGGKPVAYYNTAAASIGFQIGAQAKSVILCFMQESALKKFRASSGWEVGVDGSVAIVDVGAGKSVNTTNLKDPIVGFVFDQKGLMANLTLEGSKFTKINPE
jgi:lipid-binding SYLF domain-containing protein